MFLIHQKILLPSIFQVQFVGIGWFANQYVKKSPGNRIIVAEGYATAATVHEATGNPVIVAFDSGNLKAVAETWRGSAIYCVWNYPTRA